MKITNLEKVLLGVLASLIGVILGTLLAARAISAMIPPADLTTNAISARDYYGFIRADFAEEDDTPFLHLQNTYTPQVTIHGGLIQGSSPNLQGGVPCGQCY